MNKKGFTLVELLAVIAILAILVIIALPNVLGMFNQAKKNSFETELKDLMKTAQSQWFLDNTMTQDAKIYSRVGGTKLDCTDVNNELQLSGRKELDYAIKLNRSGQVVALIARDGTYEYVYGADDGTGLTGTSVMEIEQLNTSGYGNITDITSSSTEHRITCSSNTTTWTVQTN